MPTVSPASRLLALAGLLAFCVTGAWAADLRIGVMTLARTVDPHIGGSRPEYLLHDQIYEGLTGADGAFQPIPQLAERWEQLPDGSWLFHLRRGVRFQNGRPFTARDVVFSFCRTAKVGTEPRIFAARLIGVAAVETPDPYSVLVRTRTPMMIFPTDIASIPIVSAPEEVTVAYTPGGCAGDNWVDSRDFADPGFGAGTGPFRLLSHGPEEVVVERNPHYWGRLPDWERVQLTALAEADRVRAMVEGRIDILDGPPLESLPFFAGQPGMDLVEGPSSGVFYMQVNQRPNARPGQRNPFADIRVRRALLLAVPRSALADRIVPGFGAATGQMALPGMGAYALDIPNDEYDPAMARRLLAEAGYPAGLDTTMLISPMQAKLGDAIAYFLDKVGVRAKVAPTPMDVFGERVRSGDFEMFSWGWIFSPANLPDGMRALLGSGVDGTGRGAHNYAGYDNPAIDQLLLSIQAEANPATRDELTRKAARALHDDAAWLPLLHARGRWIVRRGIRLEPRLDRMILAKEITTEPATR